MWISKTVQSRTALALALGLTSTTVFSSLVLSPALANTAPVRLGQLFQGTQRVSVPSGTRIQVRYDEAERVIVTPTETSALTLTVVETVRTPSGTAVIPVGSRIEGELRPAQNGTQFVAETVILPGNERRIPLDATSPIITERETLSRRSDPDILRGAAIGAAAAAVLSEIFGSIDVLPVLAGAGLGALAEVVLRGRQEVEVIVVRPDTDLDLTLQSDFVLQ